MKRLDNNVAIVPGASKGIEAGIAKAFAAEGAAEHWRTKRKPSAMLRTVH